jgi:hypothetical protein
MQQVLPELDVVAVYRGIEVKETKRTLVLMSYDMKSINNFTTSFHISQFKFDTHHFQEALLSSYAAEMKMH